MICKNCNLELTKDNTACSAELDAAHEVIEVNVECMSCHAIQFVNLEVKELEYDGN